MRNADLEHEIFEHPDDIAPYAVYSDWLLERDDPRGKLIALQLARAAQPDAKLDDAERELLAILDEPVTDEEPAHTVAWHAGFWRGLDAGAFGWTARPLRDDHVTALLACASARFVRRIHLQGTLTPAVFEPIAATARTLEQLDVSCGGDQVDDDCLRALRGCSRLRELALFSCKRVTDLAPLRELRALEAIDLRNHRFTDAGALCLAELPRLARVHFNALVKGFTATGMAALGKLPLRSLEFFCADRHEVLDDACVAALAGNTTLANVMFDHPNIAERASAVLATLPLRRLSLRGGMTDAGVRELGPLASTLRSLHLGHGSFGDGACATIAGLNGLAFLDVASTEITSAGLRALAPLGALEQLDLAFLDLDDRDVAQLARAFPRLRSLSLAMSGRITDAACDALADLPALRRLDVSSTAITPRGIDRLARLAIEEIYLEYCASDVIDLARAHTWHVGTRDTMELWDDLDDYA